MGPGGVEALLSLIMGSVGRAVPLRGTGDMGVGELCRVKIPIAISKPPSRSRGGVGSAYGLVRAGPCGVGDT
ncbi:hypothetical protein GCM10010486_61390 [Nonomuraea roseoviolacea subsp. carminata]